MKKRTLRILFLILLCGVLMSASLPFTVSAEGGAAVSVGSASGKAGDTVTVDVKLTDNPGVIAMNLGVDFDNSKLELVDAKSTGVLNGYSSAPDYSGGHYTLNWEDGLATTNNNGTGTVATLTFKLKEDCDTASVSVSGVGHDADVNSVSVSGGSGTITNTNPPKTTTTTTTAASSSSGTSKADTSTTASSSSTTTQRSGGSSNSTATTTRRATTTAAYTRSYNVQNTYPVDFQVPVITEVETTEEESTTDLLDLWETMTETTTMEMITEETTTELEEQPRTPLSKTKLILIILMACFAIVGVAIIVSMVRKSKG